MNVLVPSRYSLEDQGRNRLGRPHRQRGATCPRPHAQRRAALPRQQGQYWLGRRRGRGRLGRAGRVRILERDATAVHAPRFAGWLREVAGS